MMDCTENRDRLEAHVLGFLDPEEARACEAHLNFCESCRARREEVEALLELLGRLAEGTPARPGLEERILARTAVPAPRALRRWRLLPAAAAVLVAALAGAAGYRLGLGERTPPNAQAAIDARLDAHQRQLADVRAELAALRSRDTLRASDADRIARLEEEMKEHATAFDEIQKSRQLVEEEKARTDRRIKELEKQLADTVTQLATLRDETVRTFIRVASAVSSPLVRN